MEFNPEAILDELNDFEKRDQEVTPVLEEYLLKIAKTGNIIHPWIKLRPLLKRKMELVITEFCKSCPPDTIPSYPNTDRFEYERLKTNILEAVDFFSSAPFTIQRLCELITNPKKHYNRTDKYMRGLEKNLLVVSTIEPGENDSSSDRDQTMANDWANSDSSNEAHNFNDAANNVSSTSVVNGTVLENFATVFPTAPRIANKANNIQVTIVTDASTYHHSEASDNLEYEVLASSNLKDSELHYENGNDSSSAENMNLVISSVSSASDGNEEQMMKSEDIGEADQALMQESNEADSCQNVIHQETEEPSGDVSQVEETVKESSDINCDNRETDVASSSDSVETMEEADDKPCSDKVRTEQEVNDQIITNECVQEVNEKAVENENVHHVEAKVSSKGDGACDSADTPCVESASEVDSVGEPDPKRRKYDHDFNSQEGGDAPSSPAKDLNVNSADSLSSENVAASSTQDVASSAVSDVLCKVEEPTECSAATPEQVSSTST